MAAKRGTSHVPEDAALLTFPMHGQRKMITEGYRTRDGHLTEWMARKLTGQGSVAVVSRPEPQVIETLKRIDYSRAAPNSVPVRSATLRIPNLRERRRWWVDSLTSYPRDLGPRETPAVVWNPMVALSSSRDALFDPKRKVIFDLLDDWSIHFAFEPIRDEVNQAYRRMFDRADYVTANAEGTRELARKFGRDDCVLLPNGVDPERFSQKSVASGPITVGYVGKIGKRLNLELILEVAKALPSVNFIFAGPILDAEYREPLAAMPNVELLGDVHYEKVPALLETFDIGWVPHNVGVGEVGGDVIKTYEYRAAGLPVLTTPIAGVRDRGLTAVTVLEPDEHAGWLRDKSNDVSRIPRESGDIPVQSTWEWKADHLLTAAGFGSEE